jgi:RNA ligase (TIGR02306 family)
LEAFRRYSHVFLSGERVVLTEKLDGTSSRYVYHDGRMHCGSRFEWKKEFPDYSHVTVEWLVSRGATPEAAREAVEKVRAKTLKKNLWWEVLERTPAIEKFCRDNPGLVLYGETAGKTNVLRYSETNHFAAFDILKDGVWLDHHDARHLGRGLPWVPILAEDVPYDFDMVTRYAEGKTTWSMATNKVIREGCVVKPLKERTHEKIGRVALKCVSGDYLSRNFDPLDVPDE